jgi:two-component system, chemotaxis family, chemotaxis protein CheY
MKALVVEDDFTSSKILQRLLVSNFETDIAVDGVEAIIAFKSAHEKNAHYDVIFLDIMMPKKDGHQVLKDIREYEMENKIDGSSSAKIIMTTALDDSKNVLSAFKSGCEGYIVKPYNKQKIFEKLEELGLIEV